MISLWLAAALVVGGQDAVQTSIHIPRAIGPAVQPYMRCIDTGVMERSRAAGPQHAASLRKIVAEAKAACEPVRGKARAEAMRLIVADASVPEADRAKTVDGAFAAIDQSSEDLLAQIERAEKANQAKP